MRGETESLLGSWLTLQCQAIGGAEAALAFLGASEHAPGACVAHWPTPAQCGPRLTAGVEAARESGRLVVQAAPDLAEGPRAVSHLALPILGDGCVVGAVGLRVRCIPSSDLKALADRLGASVRALERSLETQRDRDRLAARLSLAGLLLDPEALGEAAYALTAELARQLDCQRVALGMQRRGRLRLVGLSASPRFAPESDAVRALCAAMEEATDQDATIALPAAQDVPPRTVRAHELLLRGSGAGSVCSVPLASGRRAVGALTCEWRADTPPSAARRERVCDAALLAGPILSLRLRSEAGPIERAKARLVRLAERHFGANHALARVVAGALAALLLVAMLIPAPYRIAARATLEGRVERALVAGIDGYLAEAHARPGDLVAEGDVLARLDDRDLHLEQRKRQSRRAQLEKEYREALAGSDRTRVSILRAQIEQAAAQLALVDEQLARTLVVAPFAGIVLEGDLDRSLGSPVERGHVLFEIAPLEGYRIIIEVDGRDIADVAVGQRGRLALAALPDRPLPLVVERITPISSSEDGRSYFRVEAVLEEPSDSLRPASASLRPVSDSLRPGMEGIAKIDAGRRRLLWIWTHAAFDWLRLASWSWLP